MMYEAGWLFLFIIVFGSPSVYSLFWEPRFVNKSDDYFCIAKIERKAMSVRKWIFFYVIWFFVVLAYDSAYQVLVIGDETKEDTFIGAVVLLCLFCVLMFVCCRNHSSLPLRRYLNAEEMIKSIEKERFYQVAEGLWYSHSWIRVSTKFYPKSIVTDFHIAYRSGGFAAVYIYTIIGKMYRCYDFGERYKTLSEKANRLIETLPISELADMSSRWARLKLQDINERDMFKKYMKTHTTTEFINSSELLSLVVEKNRKQYEEEDIQEERAPLMPPKSVRVRTKAQEREKLWTEYISLLLWMVIIYLFSNINYITQYIEISEFKENGILVTAKIITAENYDRNHRRKYTVFRPKGNIDLTLEFELDGKVYLETYRNVEVYSSEANQDWYSHIYVYVLPDASDIQTKIVVDECMQRALSVFGIKPGILLILWVVGICLVESKSRKGE